MKAFTSCSKSRLSSRRRSDGIARYPKIAAAVFAALMVGPGIAVSQTTSPGTATRAVCSPGGEQLPFCDGVRGDRAEGWLPQTRSEVMSRYGMVTTSQPLAAQAGLRILMAGGNAIDAAVATAATLNLVEPMNVGLAADMFAIVYSAKDHKIYQINASGTAPSGATLDYYNSLGWQCTTDTGPGCGMPSNGILAVTVPAALKGWDAMLKRFGSMTFKDVLQPAIDYAENGFPVSERISHDWSIPSMRGLHPSDARVKDPDTIAAWTINGQSPLPGQIFKNPDLAHTFRLIQQQGADVFYEGEIAKAIVAKSTQLGGTMTLDDLAKYQVEWQTPAMTTYQGRTVYELPPPSQAWATLEMLNILEQCSSKMLGGKTLAEVGPASPAFWHFLIEAKKLAYSDLYHYNGDPDSVNVPVADLLKKSYAASLCSQINPNSSTPSSVKGNAGSDTIVLSTADRWGNVVSWVNSNYASFGSGITVPGYGFVLHNRGALFSLWPGHNNVIAPHKHPFNTLSAGLATQPNGSVLAFQLMGGSQQAQGHMQVLVNMFDLGANLQAATDMARFSHDQASDRLQLESELYYLVKDDLLALGHPDVELANGSPMGGYQALLFTPSAGATASNGPVNACNTPAALKNPNCASQPVAGYFRAGSDHRKDGEAVAF
jgi:gamma-glutamyltranspeptidase/glutathione hydrolase